MSIKAALICVGSELLRGKLNTHGSMIARALARVSIELGEEQTVSDDPAALAEAIRRARRAYPVVIVTGGLGPTFDDVTREAAARACRRPLHRSTALLARIREKFRRARYRSMPPANARQADLIEGAIPIPNANGTAPGQWLLTTRREERGEKRDGLHPRPSSLLILLPGPPREMEPMLNAWVLPRLRRLFPPPPRAEAHLHFVGIPESKVDHQIRPIIHRWVQPLRSKKGLTSVPDFTILAHPGLVDLDLFVSASTRAQAKHFCRRVVRQVQAKLVRFCYGVDAAHPLEKVVGELLRRQHATVAVAESCTGGMIAARLSDIPGSSDYLLGGIIAYNNASKVRELGVPEHLIARDGAVSASVAGAMAEGVRARFGSRFGLAITGIAGPGGGTPAKAVGTVFIALSTPRRTTVRSYHFSGSRDAVRQRSVVMALDLVRRSVLAEI